MKQDTSNSNLPEIETSELQRKEAVEKFINPVKTPRPKRNWLKLGLLAGGSVLVAAVVIAVVVYENSKPVAVPSTFDVSAMKATISPNNSVQMTFDAYTQGAPPIWDGQNKTLTVPVPILFANNRNPTLKVEKVVDTIDGEVDQIQMDDLEPGDVIFSPIDGTLNEQKEYEDSLHVFYLNYTDSQGNNIAIEGYCSLLKPLVSFADATPVTDDIVSIPIKKGQPIGEITASDNDPHIGLIGAGPFMKSFNLAVNSERKVILLTK